MGQTQSSGGTPLNSVPDDAVGVPVRFASTTQVVAESPIVDGSFGTNWIHPSSLSNE